MTTRRTVRALIGDDHFLVRSGMRAMLSQIPGDRHRDRATAQFDAYLGG